MSPSHGGGLACYKGHRPKTGTCQECRSVNAERHHSVNLRYERSAKGLVSRVRRNAMRRTT